MSGLGQNLRGPRQRKPVLKSSINVPERFCGGDCFVGSGGGFGGPGDVQEVPEVVLKALEVVVEVPEVVPRVRNSNKGGTLIMIFSVHKMWKNAY